MKLTSKSIYLTFIFFIFSLMLFTNQSFANDNKSFQLKPGDIIITKGPVLNGFLVTVVWQLIMTLYFKLKAPGINH